MTHPTYTQQALSRFNLPKLKRIAAKLGVTPTTDKRATETWINAILRHQTAQLQKIDEQATAQAELDQYISEQAQAIAPEELTTVEINCHHFEIFAGTRLIAYISYDHGEFVTQPWLVMVNGEEIFRDTTVARCLRFIQWHHQDGTLPTPLPAPVEVIEVPAISEISFYDQEASVDGELVASVEYDHDNHEDLYWRVLVNNIEIFRDLSAARCHSYIKQQYQQGTLPVQEPFVEPCTTGNEIMAVIFTECEKYGLELLDDGIYQDNQKLGEVGCTDGHWWIIRASSEGQKVACDSVVEAVQSLSVVNALPHEELLDMPFDQLNADEWQKLLEYGLVAA